MRPDFSDIPYNSSIQTNGKKSLADKQSVWNTPEQIEVKPAFTKSDIKI